MTTKAPHQLKSLKEGDVVPLPAIVPADKKVNYRARLRNLRNLRGRTPLDVDGKDVVEALLGEREEPIIPASVPQTSYAKFKNVWYEKTTLGLFFGPDMGLPDDRFLIRGEAVEEVLNDFDQKFLAPRDLSWTAALELGLVVFLGQPNGPIKLIIARNKKKVKLAARSRAWIKMLFRVDDLDRVDVTSNVDPPYSANSDVIIGQFVA